MDSHGLFEKNKVVLLLTHTYEGLLLMCKRHKHVNLILKNPTDLKANGR